MTVHRRNVNKKAWPRYKKGKGNATVHLWEVHRISAVLHFWYPFSAHMTHHETLIGGWEGVRWPLMTVSRALGGFQEHLRPRVERVMSQLSAPWHGEDGLRLFTLPRLPKSAPYQPEAAAIDEHTRSIKVGAFQQENMAAEKRNKAHSISAAEELVSGGKHYATSAFTGLCATWMSAIISKLLAWETKKATSVMGADWVQTAWRENKDKHLPVPTRRSMLAKHTHTVWKSFLRLHALPRHHAALSCRLVCSFTPNMASHCALTQASRPWRSSVLSERTHHVFSCFTVCARKKQKHTHTTRRDDEN